MKKENMFIEGMNPLDLSQNELRQIAEVEKDLWAHGIWEYVKCKNCWLIHSKDDIFWHVASEIKTESVTKLEEIIGLDSINCNICENDTEFIYDIDENLVDIKKRLFESKISFLTLLRNLDNGDIHGFMDWYIDKLSNIFNREFSSHYEQVWYDGVKKSLESTLWFEIPQELFTISSIWTNEKNKSLNNFLNLIRDFVLCIPEKHLDTLWIVEFNTWSNIHALYHVPWFKKIELIDWAKSLVANKSSTYNSDLYYLPNMIKECREHYSYPIKQFIRLYWRKMKEVLVN